MRADATVPSEEALALENLDIKAELLPLSTKLEIIEDRKSESDTDTDSIGGESIDEQEIHLQSTPTVKRKRGRARMYEVGTKCSNCEFKTTDSCQLTKGMCRRCNSINYKKMKKVSFLNQMRE